LENNADLYGKVPVINNNLLKCYYSGTSLCYTDEVKNKCTLPKKRYDCSKCVDKDNTSIVNGLCKCNEGYSGAGYIGCNEIENIEDYHLYQDEDEDEYHIYKSGCKKRTGK